MLHVGLTMATKTGFPYTRGGEFETSKNRNFHTIINYEHGFDSSPTKSVELFRGPRKVTQ